MKARKQRRPITISARRVSVYVEKRQQDPTLQEWVLYFADRIVWTILTAKLVAFAIKW